MVPKPGKDPKDLKSYRPISLLSVLNKVFEKLLHRHLLDLLPSDALPDHQFGFRSHHSTTDQLGRVATTILQGLEEQQFCSGAFLDVAQAFDRVWHDGLLIKLARLLPSNICTLLHSYLSARSFFVVFGSHRSSPRPITAGVPQGSVLGPLLYALYTADLPEASNSIYATFADDTAILSLSDNYHTAVSNLQCSLNALSDWAQKWKIQVNTDKSVNITFALRSHPYTPISFNSSIIPYRSVVRYLGLHLDERLTYSAHVRIKRKELDLRLQNLSWLLGRQSHLSLENKRLLYLALLRPIWTYALPIWGCASNSLRNIIQRHQNKTLRLIAGAPWYVRNDTLHQDLRISTVSEVIQTLSMRHEKRLHSHSNVLALSILDTGSHRRRLQRRHPMDLPALPI